jgi:hypothetical protein
MIRSENNMAKKTDKLKDYITSIDSRSGNEGLLKMSLGVAVFMWIHRLKGQPWEHIQERMGICSQHIAEKGDRILFKTEGTAEAFNHLAEGIACLSFAPGGVTCFGQHWEAKHPDLQGTNESENDNDTNQNV